MRRRHQVQPLLKILVTEWLNSCVLPLLLAEGRCHPFPLLPSSEMDAGWGCDILQPLSQFLMKRRSSFIFECINLFRRYVFVFRSVQIRSWLLHGWMCPLGYYCNSPAINLLVQWWVNVRRNLWWNVLLVLSMSFIVFIINLTCVVAVSGLWLDNQC